MSVDIYSSVFLYSIYLVPILRIPTRNCRLLLVKSIQLSARRKIQWVRQAEIEIDSTLLQIVETAKRGDTAQAYQNVPFIIKQLGLRISGYCSVF